jgi:hypothetical protein
LELAVAAAEAAPLRQECLSIRELLDVMVLAVRGEDIPVPIHREAIGGGVELAVPTARNPRLTRRGTGLEAHHVT